MKLPRFAKITFHLINKKKITTIIEENMAKLDTLDFPKEATRFKVTRNDGSICFLNPIHVTHIEAEIQ